MPAASHGFILRVAQPYDISDVKRSEKLEQDPDTASPVGHGPPHLYIRCTVILSSEIPTLLFPRNAIGPLEIPARASRRRCMSGHEIISPVVGLFLHGRVLSLRADLC